ncbi:histidine kinase [Flavobacterium filum]|uniref:sensor histidine kinase n=1 Tax=Flavobacterium filum TaxID=370974 RepID=UPI0023F17FF3|nr:histidine kinase [Flavobacterium filum]
MNSFKKSNTAIIEQKEQWVIAKAELILVLLLGFLYFIMAIFGRGAFWGSFEKINLFFIIFTFPFVFILNTYLLLPLLVKKHRWLLYIFSLIIIQLILESARLLLASSETSFLFGEQNTVTPFIVSTIVSWIFISIRDWLINIRVIERLKAEKLRSELDFLKVQIDPHFLFNTLNSMYALALEENSSKTADCIIKLSALMRYNLHDSNEELISIEKEIDYIEKYIALQNLRLNDNNRIEVLINIDKKNNHKAKIAPLILIPFIENVFKYGVSPSKPTEIIIHILVTKDYIELKTKNDIVEVSANTIEKGVGLKNVKNRLDLLYTNLYELSSGTETNKYFSYLKINLKQ